MADQPLSPATDRRLGRPLPHQLPNQTRVHPSVINLWYFDHAVKIHYAVLPFVSKRYPPLKGRLLTRYSPVRHSVISYFIRRIRNQASFDLHVLSTPPAFILSQDRTLRPKCIGPRARPVPSVIADRFRSIHMVLFDRKRNSSGPPLGGLAKNESKSDHFKWFDVCPDATHHVCPSSQYPVLKVHACASHPVRPGRAARRYIARPEGPAGRESGCTQLLHIYTRS